MMSALCSSHARTGADGPLAAPADSWSVVDMRNALQKEVCGDPAADYKWLQNYTHYILSACRFNASDGTVL